MHRPCVGPLQGSELQPLCSLAAVNGSDRDTAEQGLVQTKSSDGSYLDRKEYFPPH